MSEIMEDIAYLSQEIGPRPAGTEEEQQAAFYISDMMKKRTGLETVTEDFSCNPRPDLINVILSAIAIILSIAAMIANIVVIPAILVGILCAVFFVFEATGRPLLSRAFARGVSQNVVSKYQPVGSMGRRTRKIILVANYDSGKVRKDLASPSMLPVIKTVSIAAMVAIPVIWVLRAIFALEASGTAAIVWNVITVVVLLLAALPIIFFAIQQSAEYNEAANCNAASVALMMEIAKRITSTPVAEAGTGGAQIHGEQAAREEGLIPEGAEISYEAPAAQPVPVAEKQAAPEEPQATEAPAPEAPVQEASTPAAESFVYIDENLGWPEEYSYHPQDAAAANAVAGEPESEPSVPEWFTKAQEKANKPVIDDAPVRRSRFASALDQAVETSHARAQEAAAAERASRAAAFASYHEAARLASRPAAHAAQDIEAAGTLESAAENAGEALAAATAAQAAASVLPVTDQQTDQVEQARVDAADLQAQSVHEAAEEPFTGKSSLASVAKRVRESAPAAEEEAPASPATTEAVPVRETVAMPRIDVNELIKEAEANRSKEAQQREAAAAEPAAEPAAEAVSAEPVAAAPAAQAQAPVAENRAVEEPAFARNPILDDPSLVADLPQIESGMSQRAPLAGDSLSPSLSARIPRVNLDAFGISTAGNAEPMDNKRAALRNMLPSMSGSISLEPAPVEEEPSTVSRTGSFAPVGLSGSIGPVGDELIDGVDPEEIYVDDVDDSDYATTMTETGAYAGPGYVDMPESRASQFFGRFRRKKDKKDKKDKKEPTPQQWLNVEDDFNPTKVGSERGNWESFNEENRGKYENHGAHGADHAQEDEWNGGAFSKVREKAAKLGKKKDVDPEFSEQVEEIEPVEEMPAVVQESFEEAAVAEEPQADEQADPAPTRHAKSSLAAIASMYADESDVSSIQAEVKQIEDFHLKNVDVEVWFVALGSENASNGGSRAFLAEHAGELDGALIINLEGLGAGAFCQIGTEGTFGSKIASPRLKHLVKKAQQMTGVTFTNSAIRWKDSIASIALKRGMHAITLAGMEKDKPAYMGQGDDVIENVEAETLHRRAEFLEALIRHA